MSTLDVALVLIATMVNWVTRLAYVGILHYYVGETGHPVHHRGNQHRSDIQGGHKNIPSVRHFKKCGVENLKLTVLEKVRSQNQEIRKARESYWISRLNPAINKLTT